MNPPAAFSRDWKYQSKKRAEAPFKVSILEEIPDV
jgi:hypothetical protein